MMNANDVRSLLATVTVDQVMRAYSGKKGKCYCGCSGTYWTNSAHVEAAGKDRGYEVTPDEVSDKQVKRVLGIVKENFAVEEGTPEHSLPYNVQGEDGSNFVTHFTAEVGNRSYTVYLLPKG